jgi:hypothetical protein
VGLDPLGSLAHYHTRALIHALLHSYTLTLTHAYCPPGKWQPKDSKPYCDDVKPGKQVVQVMNASSASGAPMVDEKGQPLYAELTCPSGKFSEASSSGGCQHCEQGKVQSLAGRASCEDCSGKQYIKLLGTGARDNRTCMDCPRSGVTCDGTYRVYTGGMWHDPTVLNPTLATAIYTCPSDGCPEEGAAIMQCQVCLWTMRIHPYTDALNTHRTHIYSCTHSYTHASTHTLMHAHTHAPHTHSYAPLLIRSPTRCNRLVTLVSFAQYARTAL